MSKLFSIKINTIILGPLYGPLMGLHCRVCGVNSYASRWSEISAQTGCSLQDMNIYTSYTIIIASISQ